MNDRLPVAEIFGPVWQGEGPHTGQLAIFLRLGLCNLSCEWCDTPYTWDREHYDLAVEAPDHSVDDVLRKLEVITDQHSVGMIVLSGGEPMIHQRNATLAAIMKWINLPWHVETNGTLTPTEDMIDKVQHFTVSPKINTTDPEHRRLKPLVLKRFAGLADQGKAAFKIVCRTTQDVEYAARCFDAWQVPGHARWIMPEGVLADTVIKIAQEIADRVLDLDMNLTLRQHVLMYGSERFR